MNHYHRWACPDQTLASGCPGSNPKMGHHTWVSGCTRHPAARVPQLLRDSNHTGDPAGPLFSCSQSPGDHSVWMVPHHGYFGTSYSVQPTGTGVGSGLRAHSCLRLGSFLRAYSAFPSAAFATTCCRACTLVQTMLWPATRSHLHTCFRVCSTGSDTHDLSHHLAVCTRTAVAADLASDRCSRSSS